MSTAQATPSQRFASIFGFSKVYNAFLYLLFATPFLTFILFRLHFLDYDNGFCGRRHGRLGECFYYSRPPYRWSMRLHLLCVIPAGMLALLQFLPIVRRKAIGLHRWNGRVVVVLTLVGTALSILPARVSFGGMIETQSAFFLLAILVFTSLAKAWLNIRRLRIDRHRAWMLRAWFYLGAILSNRIILLGVARVIAWEGRYRTTRPCAQLAYMHSFDRHAVDVATMYPACVGYANGSDPGAVAVVTGRFGGLVSESFAAYGIGFGASLWLGIFLNALGVELYIEWTHEEGERLRKVSLERRIAAGYEKRVSVEVDKENKAVKGIS